MIFRKNGKIYDTEKSIKILSYYPNGVSPIFDPEIFYKDKEGEIFSIYYDYYSTDKESRKNKTTTPTERYKEIINDKCYIYDNKTNMHKCQITTMCYELHNKTN